MNKIIRFDEKALEPEFISKRIEALEERIKTSWRGTHLFRDSRLPGIQDLVLISNDYLSLGRHPEIIRAQKDSLERHGNGMVMSAVFLHGPNPQHEFEQALARHMDAEAAVLCQSGWAANVGLLQAIADRSIPVYIDLRAHMSLWEGITSAGATPRPFRHNNPDHLAQVVASHGQGVVVVDSLYSTQGDLCPLADIVEVAERHGCVLVVDESHALGTHGAQGEGLVAELGLSRRVHFRTASLAKAFAGRAGVIACSRRFADYFPFESRPAIFSSALLPHEIAGLHATLKVIRRDHWRRQRLHDNAAWLRRGLDAGGYNVAVSQSQIVPLEAGSEPRLVALQRALEARGVFGAAFVAPATPRNGALIRLSVNCALEPAQLERIVAVCRDIRDEVEAQAWAST
ncbi:MAG: quorum-sensing autoinducer CAI-1 synthase, partial [Pseudomonadota bacterium]|nr:quorum-sensing autoinducer CAI-1 synthase [Pseudomonadota bacterium]